MIIEVLKGVDAEIEFKGFSGVYFYYMAGAILGAILLTFILYIIGFNSILVVIFMLAMVIVIFVYINAVQSKYGRFGRIHAKHKSIKPTNIILDKDFKSFIK